MRSHLLNGTTTEHYRRSVLQGVERVAAALAAADRPFTGATPDALAPLVEAIDLVRSARSSTTTAAGPPPVSRPSASTAASPR